MFPVKLIKYWYIFLTILVIICPSKVTILEFIPGTIFIWIVVYLFFYFGYNFNKIALPSKLLFISKNKIEIPPIIVGCVMLLYIPFYINFYSGNSISTVFEALKGTNNNYANYQVYLDENNLSELTLKKLPVIFSFGILKFLASISILKIVVFKIKKDFKDYISLVLIYLAFLYSSIGRGTSFEIFEIVLLSVFAYLLKRQISLGSIKFGIRTKFYFIVIATAGLIYFINNISKRYGVDSIATSDLDFINCSTEEMCVSKESFIYSISPTIALAIFQLSNYFIFGLFFISKLLSNFVIKDLPSFLSIIIPNGTKLYFNHSFKELICGRIIDCSSNWIPEIVNLITLFGLFGTIIFMFFIGILANKVYKKINYGSIYSSLLLFYILFFIVSLPTGNFVSVSSSNQICVLLSLIGFIFIDRYQKNVA